MKYNDLKQNLRQSDPELDSRVRAEKLRADLAVAIARKRENEGLSQSGTARIAHLTQQQISKIENGENRNIDTCMTSNNLDFSSQNLSYTSAMNRA